MKLTYLSLILMSTILTACSSGSDSTDPFLPRDGITTWEGTGDSILKDDPSTKRFLKSLNKQQIIIK